MLVIIVPDDIEFGISEEREMSVSFAVWPDFYGVLKSSDEMRWRYAAV